MVMNDKYNLYSIYIKRHMYGSFIGEGLTTTIKLIPIVIHASIPNAPLDYKARLPLILIEFKTLYIFVCTRFIISIMLK